MEIDLAQYANLGLGAVVAGFIYRKLDTRLTEFLKEFKDSNTMHYALLHALAKRQDVTDRRIVRLESVVLEGQEVDDEADDATIQGFRKR